MNTPPVHQRQEVPAFDPGPQLDSIRGELIEAIERVLDSGAYVLAREVQAFESKAAAFLGVKFAVGVNSGTDALTIALRSCGVGPGDEVITSSFTFFATAEAIAQVGAVPRFVDISPDTFNLNPSSIEGALSRRTKAILPVHLYGHSADLDPILDISGKHRLVVVEDAAQAFGGSYKERMVGSFGNAAAFSFFPTKNLSTYGDGGLIATNDQAVAAMARALRTHGSIQKYQNEMLGYNSRLDELHAAILNVKLPYLAGWNEERREIANRYSDSLQDLPIGLPTEREAVTHVFHQYTIRLDAQARDVLRDKLAKMGVSSTVYYPSPVHRLPIYVNDDSVHLPETERASHEVLSLPIYPGMTSAQQGRVVDGLRRALSEI